MPNQQEVFEAAHAHVAKWEGGYFDHPNDPGGVTMYGVSLMFLKGLDLWEGDIDGDGDIDRDDVLAVTKDTARDIFKRHFWDRPRAGEMPPLVAVCFYDFAVNAGVPRAARMLQGLLHAGRTAGDVQHRFGERCLAGAVLAHQHNVPYVFGSRSCHVDHQLSC